MSKPLRLLFLAIIVFACNNPEPSVIKTWPDGSQKMVVYHIEADGKKLKVKEEQFYENGQMEFSGTFDKEGRRHGDWKYWYDNGNLWSEGSFDHGEKTGKKRVYWPSGILRYEGQYSKNKETGTWKFYNQEGRQDNEVNFDGQNQNKNPG